MRRVLFLLVCLLPAAPAAAQSAQELAQMRLYVQQLEQQVRQLTGQNEQLHYQLNQMRAQSGLPPVTAMGEAVPGQPAPGQLAPAQLPGQAPAPGQLAAAPAVPAEGGLGAPPRDLGSISIAADDPLLAPDGVEHDLPVDLSVLAGGQPGAPGQPVDPATGAPVAQVAPGAPPAPDTQVAGLPQAPRAPAALSGSPRDEYDLAYGYILTGDYDLAEQSFSNWLAAFPGEQQAADARYWLAESHLQQKEYRDAANGFLALYKETPQGAKAPDALMKLGVSLAALGEKDAACATFSEVGRKYPNASQALMGRVRAEAGRAGC
jgi:tol-pal system protein YbgF